MHVETYFHCKFVPDYPLDNPYLVKSIMYMAAPLLVHLNTKFSVIRYLNLPRGTSKET